jgi:anti-sigma-K factor RskA
MVSFHSFGTVVVYAPTCPRQNDLTETLCIEKLALMKSTEGDAMTERESRGRWRWTKVALIVVALLALAVLVMFLVPGGHTPGRHG